MVSHPLTDVGFVSQLIESANAHVPTASRRIAFEISWIVCNLAASEHTDLVY
jgi:hypothetical protein